MIFGAPSRPVTPALGVSIVVSSMVTMFLGLVLVTKKIWSIIRFTIS